VRLVAKFGGTSLGSGERIDRAADSITDVVQDGHEIVVVASAMGSSTDDLLSEISFEASDQDRAEIVSMGERTSVRMLKAALTARGVPAVFVEPGTPDWPIVVDGHGEVDQEETARRMEKLAETLGDAVPVVTGFLAEDPEGNITTLGRGGSDTTAVMMGRYIGADEVVIVTDVEGVMTGDPRSVEGARNVGQITVDELRSLSFRGAEVVAPSALSYKTDDFDVRVIHYQHGNLLSGGTDIVGEFRNLIDMRERPLACVTVAGRAIRNQAGVLGDLTSVLGASGINVDTVASGLDSITFYVDAEDGDDAQAILHDAVVKSEVLSSCTVDSPVAVVRITSGELSNHMGSVMDILDPLVEKHIAIHDVITSASSVAVFVDWDDGERALGLIQTQFD